MNVLYRYHRHSVIPLLTLQTLLLTVSLLCCTSILYATNVWRVTGPNYRDIEQDSTDSHGMENDCRNSEESKEENVLHKSLTASLALVPFDETKIGPFHHTKRWFRFSDDHEVVIEQNWRELGVAAVVWDAAVVLCEYLAKNLDVVRDKRIIELGAGTGLVGILASSLGADVTITDRNVALRTIRTNVQHNIKHIKNDNDCDINSDSELTCDITVTEIQPASATDFPTLASSDARNSNRHCASCAGRLIVRELTWGSEKFAVDFPEPFDVVLGADIVYIEETFSDLIRTMAHLARDASRSVVLIAARLRYERDSAFFAHLAETFDVEELMHDKARDVRIFRACIKQ